MGRFQIVRSNALVSASVGMLVACAPPDPEPMLLRQGDLVSQPFTQQVPAPLVDIPCTISVSGAGNVDIENDYLPRVIRCENGGANLQSLKAQAIAARSVAYYSLRTTGSICNSQSCQVYSCGAEPGDKERQAVAETSGVYLTYNGLLTYGFYVAGSSAVQAPSCTGTESWVTYNEGKVGDEIKQTSLGSKHSPGHSLYGQNRGCFSQWGSRCLENQLEYDFVDILRFYYGADIGIAQASGPCIEEISDDGEATGFLTFDSSLPGLSGVGDGGGPGAGGGVTGITFTDGVATVYEGVETEPQGLPDSYGGLRPGDGVTGCSIHTRRGAYGWGLLLIAAAVCRRRRGRRIAT